MGVIEIAAIIVMVIALAHFWIVRKAHQHKGLAILEQMETDETIKRTLAMGLYYRFKRKEQPRETRDGKVIEETHSNIFIREGPIHFEEFAAQVLAKHFDGTYWVSPPSGDFGVDFEIRINNKKYLGQAKCYKDDIHYEPIAVLHSNVVKEKADGGFFVTTSSYNKNALKYINGLDNIQLIDGVPLVEHWLDGIKQKDQELIGRPENV
ncbi:restriction endonuclease [Thalassobacillus devorans]|uniref:restriction endonuclease n=1 Tax=Thalassobacillus devorans TaxID=279813 RepID=UPI0020CB60F1|nr:restriction endonuclease [Thalassobacillus devorans]